MNRHTTTLQAQWVFARPAAPLTFSPRGSATAENGSAFITAAYVPTNSNANAGCCHDPPVGLYDFISTSAFALPIEIRLSPRARVGM